MLGISAFSEYAVSDSESIFIDLSVSDSTATSMAASAYGTLATGFTDSAASTTSATAYRTLAGAFTDATSSSMLFDSVRVRQVSVPDATTVTSVFGAVADYVSAAQFQATSATNVTVNRVVFSGSQFDSLSSMTAFARKKWENYSDTEETWTVIPDTSESWVTIN